MDVNSSYIVFLVNTVLTSLLSVLRAVIDSSAGKNEWAW